MAINPTLTPRRSSSTAAACAMMPPTDQPAMWTGPGAPKARI